jgi:GxxExxY protein
LVEIKAKSALEERDYEQILSYLKTSGFREGLIINFGASKLEFKRKINSAGILA